MFKSKIATMLSMTVLSGIAFAGAPDENAVKEAWLKNHPTMKLDKITATKIPGVFELSSKDKVFIDPTGRFLMVGGKIFDTLAVSGGNNAQPQRQQQEQPKKIDMSLLNPKNAIKFVNGNGSRVLSVFSDPDCPYCKRVEGELDKLTDTTIYLYPYPIAQLHPKAVKVAKNIWCSDNPATAWKDYMVKNIAPADKDCANPIDMNIQLANKLGINGTPTLIGPKGDVMPGAAPANVIEELFKQ